MRGREVRAAEFFCNPTACRRVGDCANLAPLARQCKPIFEVHILAVHNARSAQAQVPHRRRRHRQCVDAVAHRVQVPSEIALRQLAGVRAHERHQRVDLITVQECRAWRTDRKLVVDPLSCLEEAWRHREKAGVACTGGEQPGH